MQGFHGDGKVEEHCPRQNWFIIFDFFRPKSMGRHGVLFGTKTIVFLNRSTVLSQDYTILLHYSATKIMSTASASKKKCRQYFVEYLILGFIENPENRQLPMCLICSHVFSNEAMKPSRLQVCKFL